MLDERREDVARALFRDGLTLASGGRVTAAEGDAFMRGSLQPGRMTYYHFLDESMERRPRPEPLLEPHPGWKLCPECEGKRFCPSCDGQGWWSPEQRGRMCAGTAECYLCGGRWRGPAAAARGRGGPDPGGVRPSPGKHRAKARRWIRRARAYQGCP